MDHSPKTFPEKDRFFTIMRYVIWKYGNNDFTEEEIPDWEIARISRIMAKIRIKEAKKRK